MTQAKLLRNHAKYFLLGTYGFALFLTLYFCWNPISSLISNKTKIIEDTISLEGIWKRNQLLKMQLLQVKLVLLFISKGSFHSCQQPFQAWHELIELTTKPQTCLSVDNNAIVTSCKQLYTKPLKMCNTTYRNCLLICLHICCHLELTELGLSPLPTLSICRFPGIRPGIDILATSPFEPPSNAYYTNLTDFVNTVNITRQLRDVAKPEDNLIGKARVYFSDMTFTGYGHALDFEELKNDGLALLESTTFTTQIDFAEDGVDSMETLPVYAISYHAKESANGTREQWLGWWQTQAWRVASQAI